MARSEYNDGKSDNQCSDEQRAGEGGELSPASRSSKKESAASRPISAGGRADETPMTDFERRLEHQLALVGVRGGKSAEKTGVGRPANDQGEVAGRDGKAAGELKGVSGKSGTVARGYEITEALDFANLERSNEEPRGANNAGLGAKPSGPSAANPLPSSEAMKWDAIETTLKAAPSVAEIADNLNNLSLNITDPKSTDEMAADEGQATASFTLMQERENLPRHSLDSMDSMEYGLEMPSSDAAIDNKLRSSRAQLDISLANLQADLRPGSEQKAPPPPGTNALMLENSTAKGQLMVRLDLDNDPPPLSTHLNRAEPNPGSNRPIIIAGFLGGLSIAFIAISGYIYTLPQSDISLSDATGQGSGYAAIDRSRLALKVDNVVWKTGKALPLNIKIGGAVATSGLLVKLAGLPDDARLGNGFPTGDGAWIVPATKLEGLKLSLNHPPVKTITIGVRLLEKDGNTETGHFSSFSVYPEKSDHLAAASVHGIIAAKAGMAAIPMPRLMDSQIETVNETRNGARSQTNNGATGGAALIEADDEALGVLPEDFVLHDNKGGAVNSAMQQASRLALTTPPARAKRSGLDSAMVVSNRGARMDEKTGAMNAGALKHAITDAHRAVVREGNQYMRRGDITKARGLYEQAYKGQAPEAAMALGRSYDPNYLKRIANANEPSDSTKAMRLYREAFAGGLETAQIKIDQLAKTMKKR